MSGKLLAETTELLKAQCLTVSDAPITIGTKDTLFVIDMQNDFLPGGAFGVAEGDETVAPIAKLMAGFAAAGGNVILSRDYHPADHCSFASNGGPFPPHCIQGTKGADFADGISAALTPLLAADTPKAQVVFKGFARDVDSFGALPYAESELDGGSRLSKNKGGSYCAACWTGGFSLFCSAMKTNCNAPPDVMSILEKKAVSEAVGAPSDDKRIFVCGLAFDFCVLDTAANAVLAGYKNVHIILDASRAAHIPGIGTFGSGFLSDPKAVADKLKAAGVTLTVTSAIKA